MRRVIAAVLLIFAAVSVCGCSAGKPGANSDRHIKLPYSIEESAKDRYYFMDRKFALTSDDMKVEKTELETAEEWLEKHILTAADPAGNSPILSPNTTQRQRSSPIPILRSDTARFLRRAAALPLPSSPSCTGNTRSPSTLCI